MKKTIFGNYKASDVENAISIIEKEFNDANSEINNKNNTISDLQKKLNEKDEIISLQNLNINKLQDELFESKTLNERIIESAKLKANQIEIDSLSKLNAQLEQKLSNFENEFLLKKENAEKELKFLNLKIEEEKSKFNLINDRLNDILNLIANNISVGKDFIEQNNELTKEESNGIRDIDIDKDENIINSEEINDIENVDSIESINNENTSNTRYEEEIKKLNELARKSLESFK